MAIKSVDREFIEINSAFKKSVLESVFFYCSEFFLHCTHHKELKLPKFESIHRAKEENIILLSINKVRNLHIDFEYLDCELLEDKWEKVKIPLEAIGAFYDKSNQVSMQWICVPPLNFENHVFNDAEYDGYDENGEIHLSDINPLLDIEEHIEEMWQEEKPKKDSRVIVVDFKTKKRN